MKKMLSICFLAQALSFSVMADETAAQNLFAKRGENKENAKQAADLYSGLAQAETNSLKKAQLLTKEAEAIYYYGSKIEGKENKMVAHDRGQKTAMVAVGILGSAPGVAKDPAFKTDLALGYYWYGTNLGKWGEANGVLASLGRWPELRDNVKFIVALDETVEDYGVYRILGRGYMKVPFESTAEGLQVLKRAFDKTKTDFASLSLSRNSTTVSYYLDILKKTSEIETFCQVFTSFTKLSKMSDADLAKYNTNRLPETKSDLADFKANADLQKYAKEECL